MGLNFYQYDLFLKTPLQTGKMTYGVRTGFLVILNKNEKIYAGEAAPLSGFSEISADWVKSFLLDHRAKLGNLFKEDDPIPQFQDFFKREQLAPCLKFALDSVAYQLEANHQKKFLQNYLFDQSTKKILLNSLITLSKNDYLSDIEEYIESGFGTIKIKVGRDFEKELKAIKAIRMQFPKIAIRLDANQSWSLEEAIRNCKKLDGLNIQYCEEPLKMGFQEFLGKLNEKTSIPLAIDESIYQIKNWTGLLNYTSFCVIKPMMMGSFRHIFNAVEKAESHDNQIIVTTSLESGVGRMMTAMLASGLGSKKLAHGLHTGPLFGDDVLSDARYITEGSYHLPKSLPAENINFEHLERF